jgi:hypothetical protein
MKKYLVGFILLISSMAFSMESEEKITVLSDPSYNLVAPQILAKEVCMRKSQQKSVHLEEIALKHARRYFRNGQPNLHPDSSEYQLVFYALIAIEKAFPAISQFNKTIYNRAPRFGHKKLALLPASSINTWNANNVENFFERYEIVYEGINSRRKERDSDLKESDLTEETSPISQEEKQAIETMDKEIQDANASWKEPDQSFPLNFVYFVAWDTAPSYVGGPAFSRYFIIEVKKLDSHIDDEFRARVTIKKRFGYRGDDDLGLFYRTFFPNQEISENVALSIMGL